MQTQIVPVAAAAAQIIDNRVLGPEPQEEIEERIEIIVTAIIEHTLMVKDVARITA